MQSDHESPQLKGVVIISLPPPDNPSLGKTITAFTISDSDHHHYLPEPAQTHPQFQIPPPQNPQIHGGGGLFFTTPRKLLGFVCISLFALLFYRCLFSTTLLQQLKDLRDHDDDDHQKVQTFVFPLYHKLGTRQILLNDVEVRKMVKFVNKESLVVDDQVNDGVFSVGNSKLTSVNAAALDSSAIFPVRGNVYPDGLYFTYMLVGNPPKPFYLDIDTASDLTWIQCDAPCTSCAKGANALYKPRKNNILPPKDSLCLELQRNQNAGCEGGTCQQCDYEIEYADHSSSMGVLARDELNLMMANGSSTKLNFIFGCAYDQQGLLLNTLAKTDGILGLSKAKVSLPSQMASRGIINNVVGHCLANDVDGDGYMFLGDDFVPQWGMAWVPMLDAPSTESYYTEVMKLKYGSSLLSLGGQVRRVRRVVFDSGSSYTYFTKEAYSELVTALKEVSGEGLIQDTSDPTLPLCWQVNFPISSVSDVKQFFKTITLQFGSKWWIISTKFQIPPEGYLIINGKRNVCLGILDGSNVHDGSTIILGDISLRGQLVVFDNVNKKIGWVASDCMKPNTLLPMPFFEG
ncbi:Eukaryotic aspartyl protease family protein [Euphorbia peplus]|nr:Eukaryotic aspartyl protease family protein [Euphorbia peplus]